MAFSIQIFSFCKKGEVSEPELDRYAALIGHYASLTSVRLKSPVGSFANRSELMEAEAKIVGGRIPRKSFVVALSEEGKNPGSSISFASWLSKKQQQSQTLVFLLGGAYGLARSLKDTAHETLSLSPLTLSHGLAHLVLLEQIYRAFTILKGHPYHK
jgi:23S rRNA (pseudouridine1915-N3)-methyltransferase